MNWNDIKNLFNRTRPVTLVKDTPEYSEIPFKIWLEKNGVVLLRNDVAKQTVKIAQFPPLDKHQTEQLLTKYALQGVESVQSALRGIYHKVISETVLHRLAYVLVSLSKQDYAKIRGPVVEWKTRCTLKGWEVQAWVSYYDLVKIVEDEDFWTVLLLQKGLKHPEDEGFLAYCDTLADPSNS